MFFATTVALVLSASAISRAQSNPQLLIWINGDKGYNGLQKVGDAFARATGVNVRVQHPEGAPEKFQAAAGGEFGSDRTDQATTTNSR
jgi:maltose/maltodextrin transport system substrate-binding protein